MSTKSVKKNVVEPVKQEDVLQAVVLADNFSRNLAPLTDEIPLVSLIIYFHIIIIIYMYIFIGFITVSECPFTGLYFRSVILIRYTRSVSILFHSH